MSDKRAIILDGSNLTLEDVRWVLTEDVTVRIAESAFRKVQESRAIVEEALRKGSTLYGINTGFGKLADTAIPLDQIESLQENLILSHAAGFGRPLLPEARLMLLFRLNSLVKGYSGISLEMADFLAELFNRGVIPSLPEYGSVGASGDLAPLAHLGATMMGVGEAYLLGEGPRPAKEILKEVGLTPYRFKAKEALSLVNGTQFMTAVLARVLVDAEAVLKLADLAGTMSLEALRGSVRPFDARVHEARPHPGQKAVASNIRTLLGGSEVLESHRNCPKVQDAYSLRCIPQVHGAVREMVEVARQTLLREINSASDNPLVFENGDIVSGGNFHGQPMALVADALLPAFTSLANISERRIERMTNPDLSELPAFLVKDSGLNSGFMVVQVAAAALAAECRTLSVPASVHSIPTGAAKEDMVSMGPISVRHARQVLDLVRRIIGLEFLCAAQGLEFLKPLKPGRGVEIAYEAIRALVPPLERDRWLKPELDRIMDVAVQDRLLKAVELKLGKLL